MSHLTGTHVLNGAITTGQPGSGSDIVTGPGIFFHGYGSPEIIFIRRVTGLRSSEAQAGIMSIV